MKTHQLKTWPDSFRAIPLGLKTAEVRIDDGRGFSAGDLLELLEYDPGEADDNDSEDGSYTSATILAVVRHLEDLSKFGVVAVDGRKRSIDGDGSPTLVVCMSVEILDVHG